MGLGARLAGVQFAVLSHRRPAYGAWDGEALLGIQFSNHGRNDASKRDGVAGQFWTCTNKKLPSHLRNVEEVKKLRLLPLIEGGSGVCDADRRKAHKCSPTR
jgi:hypothetical protein